MKRVIGKYMLSPLVIDDKERLFLLRSIDSPFFERKRAKNLEDIEAFIKIIHKEMNCRRTLYLAIRIDNNLIGTLCLWNIQIENQCGEICFELLEAFRGNGIIQKVVPEFLNICFIKYPPLNKIVARCHQNNFSSQKVLWKCNFKCNNRGKKGELEYEYKRS